MKKSTADFLKNADLYFAHHGIPNCKIIERGKNGGHLRDLLVWHRVRSLGQSIKVPI
jgi:hypothetical protein